MSGKTLSDFALYLDYECDVSTVDLYYYGPINRTRLANICIACDALICIIFAVNILWVARAITVEQYVVDKKYVQMTDFAVRVKNLPQKPAYDTLE